MSCAPVVYLPPLYPHLTLYHLLYSPTPILSLVLYPPSFHFAISTLHTSYPVSSLLLHLLFVISTPYSPLSSLFTLCHLLSPLRTPYSVIDSNPPRHTSYSLSSTRHICPLLTLLSYPPPLRTSFIPTPSLRHTLPFIVTQRVKSEDRGE